MTWTMNWMAFLLVLAIALGTRLDGIAQQPDQKTDPANKAQQTQSEEMMCPMMAGLKNIEVFADGPELLLARQDELKLTEEQQRKLQDIQEQARRQAQDVLTDQQRQELQDTPDKRISLMQWNMMQMREMKKDQNKNMCPMCMEMMRKRMRGQTRPDRDGTKQDQNP